MKHKKIKQIVCLIICFLMVTAVSVRRDGKLLGHNFSESKKTTQTVGNDTMRVASDGTIVINTTSLGKDITGYGGNVPLEIFIKDGRVSDIKALPNTETPEFFDHAKTLFAKWKGKKVEEAATMKVDLCIRRNVLFQGHHRQYATWTGLCRKDHGREALV